MKKMLNKKLFFVISILFISLIFAFAFVDTTLGKYSKEIPLTLDEKNAAYTLTPDIFEFMNSPETGNRPGIEEETPTTIYQVQPGDTLESIAEKFNITVEALIVYNEIEDLDKIGIGMILHIPPSDYFDNSK